MERIPALDGLRAVAIAMVIGYHIDNSVMPAGHWGVVLFFVLSGYLLTRLLCSELDEHGRVDLRVFYLKRSVRLFPALIVFCLALLAVGIGWSRVAPAVGHYANFARIVGVDLGPLTHTWFLAVIAHFYLLWPLVISAVPERHRIRAVGLLALVAIAWRVIAIEVVSPGWVYNATDTNAAALLAGCYLGVARPKPWRFAGWSVPMLLALTLVPAFGEEGWAFHWGVLIAIALAVVTVQYATTHPAWLENSLVLWLGEISFGLYLWHYAFLRLDIPIWAALSLSVVTAAASWYLVEKPILRWPALSDEGEPQVEKERTSPALPDRTPSTSSR